MAASNELKSRIRHDVENIASAFLNDPKPIYDFDYELEKLEKFLLNAIAFQIEIDNDEKERRQDPNYSSSETIEDIFVFLPEVLSSIAKFSAREGRTNLLSAFQEGNYWYLLTYIRELENKTLQKLNRNLFE